MENDTVDPPPEAEHTSQREASPARAGRNKPPTAALQPRVRVTEAQLVELRRVLDGVLAFCLDQARLQSQEGWTDILEELQHGLQGQ